jgi:hypothetical protein
MIFAFAFVIFEATLDIRMDRGGAGSIAVIVACLIAIIVQTLLMLGVIKKSN